MFIRKFAHFKMNYIYLYANYIEYMADKPKDIILKNVPDAIWEKICAVKVSIMQRNKKRGSVSHQEAIYKLIKNNCNE